MITKYVPFILFTFFNVGVFSIGLKVRKGCRCCESCKEEKDERLRNTNIKSLEVVEKEIDEAYIDGKRIIDQNEKNLLIKIAEKNKQNAELTEDEKKFLEDKNIKKENIETKLVIKQEIKQIPKCRYYVNKDSIYFGSRTNILEKLKSHDNKDATETLLEETEKAFNCLEKHNKANSSYTPVKCGDTLGYKIMYYIGYGNCSKKIYDILFDIFRVNNTDRLRNTWQVSRLIDTESDKSTKVSDFHFDNTNKTLTFVKHTNALGMDLVHKVINKFSENHSNDDDNFWFEVQVDSNATKSNNGFKGLFMNSFLPNIYTDIIYRGKYDNERDCTYLIILCTYHYAIEGGFGGFIAKNVKDLPAEIEKQGDIVFKNLIGEKFKSKLIKECPGIFEEDKKN